MRNSLILLSSLALAASASAHDTTANSTTTTAVTLEANSHLQQIGLFQEPYHIAIDGSDFNAFDDKSGTLNFGDSQSTSSGGDGTTTFTATATAGSTLDSPNYAAVPAGSPGYDVRFQGYRFYLTLKNLTNVDQTVSFHVKIGYSNDGSAASPHGLGTYDTMGNPTHPGSYAESDFFGGVIDKSTDDVYNLPNVRSDFRATTIFGTSVANATYTSSGILDEFDAVYTLPGAQIHTYQFYAVSEAITQFNPVPEPASLAALGLGSLALLRRRKR